MYKSFKHYTIFDRFNIQTEMFEYYKDRHKVKEEILEDMDSFISAFFSSIHKNIKKNIIGRFKENSKLYTDYIDYRRAYDNYTGIYKSFLHRFYERYRKLKYR